MGQEFVIKSQQIEDKINQLLPSQGGFQPGVDFSASTTVIPIVDLTETAEGSTLRQDLQTSFSYNSATTFDITSTNVTVINNTGYWRIFGQAGVSNGGSPTVNMNFTLFDVGTKIIQRFHSPIAGTAHSLVIIPYDFIVKLEAGQELQASNNQTLSYLTGAFRQIATVQGDLVNP